MSTTATLSPCLGAVQIGSTEDLRAVWQRDGENFMVVHDAQCRAHTIAISTDEIVRWLAQPIPWSAFA